MPTIRPDQAASQLQSLSRPLDATCRDKIVSNGMLDTQRMTLNMTEDGSLQQPRSLIVPTILPQLIMEMDSTKETYGSSYSPALSLYSSASASSIAGEDKQEIPRAETPPRSIRRKPRIDDLQRSGSAPELADQTFAEGEISPKKHIARRAQSVDTIARNAAIFTSPDRYTTNRSCLDFSSSPLRTARQPSLLEVDERYYRRRISNVRAFQATNDSRQARTTTRPSRDSSRSSQPPHYTPSFVNAVQRPQRNRDDGRIGSIIRRPSSSSIWRLGGWSPVPGQLRGVDLGNGAVTASGTNAPMVDSNLFQQNSSDASARKHELRVALALGIDVAQRVLPVTEPTRAFENNDVAHKAQYRWSNGSWVHYDNSNCTTKPKASVMHPEKVVPTIAFRVLDAPRLKDDYYCSILAYCRSLRTLAVALTHRVYLWTEKCGVRYPPIAPVRQTNYVTSLAFSSEEGGRAILATSRTGGSVTLWSLLEQKSRFELVHSYAICSSAFKPSTTKRPSTCTASHTITNCEDLLVGDDVGKIYYYSVEWSSYLPGSVTLLVTIEAHTQNVCGLAWAPSGESFVSGGNDNCALFFDLGDILNCNDYYDPASSASDKSASPYAAGSAVSKRLHRSALTGHLARRCGPNPESPYYTEGVSAVGQHQSSADRMSTGSICGYGRHEDRDGLHCPERLRVSPLAPGSEARHSANSFVGPKPIDRTKMHRWSFYHSAAVKAIAFAPWQPSLLATGGGSNDRQIHFHHTGSGTTLAVINVYAQVTSLVWSSTRREIVATFGYAQPEHNVRIAVFAWPSCNCVVSIPWERKLNGEIGRALWAIPYPGGPNDAVPERLHETDEVDDFWPAQHGRFGGLRTQRPGMPPTPPESPERRQDSARYTRIRNLTRGEGETWASRTEEEGSLIVACCDQTVKFFEVWAGKSKGKSRGLGAKAGVLGGSKVLEGWCDDMAIEEVGAGEDVIQ